MADSKVLEEEEIESTESESFLSELHEPIWSVVSFEECIKSGLTYDQAVEKMNQLIPKKVAGLCIITDEAAKNM